MNDPFISIVIPLYNKEKYIGKTLQSCLEQDYDNFEILVIDDGSKDNSAQIVKSLEDKRVIYHWQENAGVSTARNNGAALANGEWIFFLDADDIILPDTLSLFAEALRQQPSAKVVVGRRWYSDKDSNVSRKDCKAHLSNNPFRDMRKRRFLPSAGTTMLHKSIFGLVKFEPSCRYYEDVLFYYSLMRICKQWAYHSIPMFIYPEDVRGLSVSPHPIEVEGAYFLTPMKFHSWSEVLSYMDLVGNCQWWRQQQGDLDGVAYYENKKKELFAWPYRIIFMYICKWHSIAKRLS